MPFTDDIKNQRFELCDGRCECAEEGHDHYGHCAAALVESNNGREGAGAWEAHHLIPEQYGGTDSLQNCRIYCWPCHERTM